MLLALVAAASILSAHGWDYPGAGSWAGSTNMCGNAGQQSPINIRVGDSDEIDDDLNYNFAKVNFGDDDIAHDVTLETNKHTWQVVYKANATVPAPIVGWGGKTWSLTEFHFQSPSEHTIDGQHAAMEMHMVHKAPDGQTLVVAVLMDVDGANTHPFLAKFWPPAAPTFPASDNVLDSNGVAVAPPVITLQGTPYAQMVPMLGGWSGIMQYSGSFTTPPCITSTRWLVLMHRARISQAQLNTYRKGINEVPANQLATNETLTPAGLESPGLWNSSLGVNNRPLQVLGARKVVLYRAKFFERTIAWINANPLNVLLLVLLLVLLIVLCCICIICACCCSNKKKEKTRAVKILPNTEPAPAPVVRVYQTVPQQQVQMMQVPMTYAAAPTYSRAAPTYAAAPMAAPTYSREYAAAPEYRQEPLLEE